MALGEPWGKRISQLLHHVQKTGRGKRPPAGGGRRFGMPNAKSTGSAKLCIGKIGCLLEIFYG